MANDEQEPKKNLISMGEAEKIAKQHSFELITSLVFLVSGLSALASSWHSIPFYVALGAIIGIFTASYISKFSQEVFSFVYQKDKITRLIFGAVAIIFGGIFPPAVFFITGLYTGKGLKENAANTLKK